MGGSEDKQDEESVHAGGQTVPRGQNLNRIGPCKHEDSTVSESKQGRV